MASAAPIVSFIIPVYNAEKYVTGAIESLLNQTADNWEVILVDDGSTDGSLKICRNFAEIDSRITVIHKENGGVGSARNIGIDAADGKYIIFLDADDAIQHTAVETLTYTAEKYNADLVLFGGYENHLNSKEIITYQKPIGADIVGIFQHNPSRKLFPALSSIHMVTRQLMRRDLILQNSIHFTNHKIAEDALFFIEYYSIPMKCIVGISDKLYDYSVRNNCSASQSFHQERMNDNFYMSTAVSNAAKKLEIDTDPDCALAIQKAIIADLQLGIKNVCLSPYSIKKRIEWLREQMKRPEVLAAVNSVPVDSCGSRNDKIKLNLLKGGFYTFVIWLVSWKNRKR